MGEKIELIERITENYRQTCLGDNLPDLIEAIEDLANAFDRFSIIFKDSDFLSEISQVLKTAILRGLSDESSGNKLFEAIESLKEEFDEEKSRKSGTKGRKVKKSSIVKKKSKINNLFISARKESTNFDEDFISARKESTNFDEDFISARKKSTSFDKDFISARKERIGKTEKGSQNEIIPPVPAMTASEEILEFWKNKGFPSHRKGTKILQKTLDDIESLLGGETFNLYHNYRDFWDIEWTPEEIKAAIDNFSLAAFDFDYKPGKTQKEKLQKVKLSDFILSYKGYSRLIQFRNPPEKQVLIIENDPPKNKPLADEIKKMFLESMRHREDINLSELDDRTFLKAADKLEGFFDKYLHTVHPLHHPRENLNDKAFYLFDCLDYNETINENYYDFHPGWLIQDFIYEKMLPEYILDNGMVMKEFGGTLVC